MAGQLELGLEMDLSPIIPATSGLTIDEAFEEFHGNNPHIYRNLRFLAFQAVNAGRKRIGIKFLFERLRWEYCVKSVHDESDYRLNNNFTALYARMLMDAEPCLDGVFEVRQRHAVGI